MSSLNYQKAERIWLKNHPEYNEAWLRDRIEEDPGILGLGDLAFIQRERRQDSGGRLDLLLADVDSNARYEVELMLGATDESHIVRCVEYWDLERRRYPAYDHCAVLVAEDITSRFLNVLGLFVGTIPMIVIQLQALRVGDYITLAFIRVLDRSSLRRDDESEVKATVVDRAYWDKTASPKVVAIADRFLRLLNEMAVPALQLNYTKHYISVRNESRSRGIMFFRPRKRFCRVSARLSQPDAMRVTLEQAGLEVSMDDDWLRVTVQPDELDAKLDALRQFAHQAYADYMQ